MGAAIVQLDFIPKTGSFVLRVERPDAATFTDLMEKHGLDYSEPASTMAQAVFVTREPFAAVAFARYALPAARAELAPLLTEIEKSWALQPGSSTWPGYLAPPSKTPYPLQLADLEYIQSRQHALDADEPGIGKTPTAIMWANLLARGRAAFRCLVIVPASIRQQWATRIREWSTAGPMPPALISEAARGVPPSDSPIQWTIISYDIARNHGISRALLANRYDLLILDEAHYLKNPSTSRTRAILGADDRTGIASRCDHVLALSGTPIPNRPREAYTLANILCPDAIDYMSERRFAERFNPRRQMKTDTGKTYVIEKQGRYPELQARLRYFFMVRHLKRDALPQLKAPSFDLVYAEENAAVRRALEKERLLDIDPNKFEGIDAEIWGAISTARLEMGIALAPQAAEYVKTLHMGGEDKLVVFAWHIEVLNILEKALDKLGVVRVDGSTSEAGKARAIVKFQNDPKIGVFLGNTLSLGLGTDGLQTVCDHEVIVEPDWVFGNNQQMVDRLHRSGQRGRVRADLFVARGSLAERILGSALRKGQVVHASLDARL